MITLTEAQLTALKGVDKEMAAYIITNRTYKDTAVIKAALLKKYPAADVAKLERYWTF